MRWVYCGLLVFVCLISYTQPSMLERKISISLKNEYLDVSLKKIADAGGFTFSYNPAIIDARKLVDAEFVNRSVRQVLDKIFKGTIHYRVRGKYIILTSAKENSANKERAIVTGYVVDEATGERLKDVSIYDPVTLSSAVTDSYGYFEIKIDRPPSDIILSVNRRFYSDTLVSVEPGDRGLDIPIRINREKITILADSVSQKLKRFWKKQAHLLQNINLENIDDTIYRMSQISLVPFVGSNHKMSGHVINDYSFNIFGGYSLGVEKLEIGGLVNLVRGDMKGVQFAGIFNGVGGQLEGVQLAGILNATRDETRGAQLAGLVNLNGGQATGSFMAGVLNLNLKETQGLQLAGVNNISVKDQKGPQLAGVFNLSAQDADPLQLAGVFNLVAKNMKGFQGAGIFNVTGKNLHGSQLAGVFNFTGKELKGTQIAGVLNFASRVKGIQIGLINVSDSIKGVPIGFLSLVWKGYHKIEISADEIFYNNLSFRTGVRQFYNIFTAGAKPATYKASETFWTFGYGFGTAPRLSRKLFLNVDLTANQIMYGKSIEAVSLLNKLYLGFDYQAFKGMSLTFGATLNGHITENSLDSYPVLFSDYQPKIFYTHDLGVNHNVKMWLGAKVGVRFL